MDTPQPVYLDCAATTAVDTRVAELVMQLMVEDFGNAGSRTHEFGSRAMKLSEVARDQVAAVLSADSSDVVFTSGATEADNLALLGLADHGRATGRMHIVTTALEHKAVLEPLDVLQKEGFTVDHVPADGSGAVSAADVLEAVRADTLLVTVMHVNNETGIRQPITTIADGLEDPGVFLHTDAAQSFGKDLEPLRHPRVDMVSISGHKVYAPKGVGALLLRRRARRRPPLRPLMYGGGQERGLRPGTLAVPLVAGLGLAAELAAQEASTRKARAQSLRNHLLDELKAAGAVINGDERLGLPHIVNLSFPGLDSEAVILALRDIVSVSNGSACTSSNYEPSHVLTAMGLSDDRRRGAIRLSWSHETTAPDALAMVRAIRALQ